MPSFMFINSVASEELKQTHKQIELLFIVLIDVDISIIFPR